MIEALILYDVRTRDQEGQRRLREVARLCEGLGQRVQYSVFELICTEAQLIKLKSALELVINAEDSIRIYRVPRGTLDEVAAIGMPLGTRTPGATIV